jgi:uncharacterized pyridoxal phosphate-containing UPF0001 family protein
VVREFRALRELFEQVNAGHVFPSDQFNVLSMGMSGDASVAIAEGSSLVRIGTAIFGEREKNG